MSQSRIPSHEIRTPEDMAAWFSVMAERDLIFHPDDPPETLVWITTNEPVFSAVECKQLVAILDNMFMQFGDKVHEAAYPIFMRAAGFAP